MEVGFGRHPAADGARAQKNYAGTSSITRATGKSRSVLARHVRNRRLADALYLQIFAALKASPGPRLSRRCRHGHLRPRHPQLVRQNSGDVRRPAHQARSRGLSPSYRHRRPLGTGSRAFPLGCRRTSQCGEPPCSLTCAWLGALDPAGEREHRPVFILRAEYPDTDRQALPGRTRSGPSTHRQRSPQRRRTWVQVGHGVCSGRRTARGLVGDGHHT